MLTGVVNPSGRLAETIPHRLEDNSSFLNFPGDSQVVRYGEGIFIGYRGYDKTQQEVAFPFGFGLSYTTFALSDLNVTTRGSAADGTLAATVTVTVTNTGTVGRSRGRAGLRRRTSSHPSRGRCASSKGSPRSHSLPAQSQQVSIELDQRAFSFWSERHGRWAVEAGDFVIAVGSNSRDLPLSETVTVEAPTPCRSAEPGLHPAGVDERPDRSRTDRARGRTGPTGCRASTTS